MFSGRTSTTARAALPSLPGAAVDFVLGDADVLEMALDPAVERGDGPAQRGAEPRQRIFDPWRDLGIGAARNEAIALEPPQRLDQHLLGDAADPPPQPRRARRAIGERMDEPERPCLRQ